MASGIWPRGGRGHIRGGRGHMPKGEEEDGLVARGRGPRWRAAVLATVIVRYEYCTALKTFRGVLFSLDTERSIHVRGTD